MDARDLSKAQAKRLARKPAPEKIYLGARYVNRADAEDVVEVFGVSDYGPEEEPDVRVAYAPLTPGKLAPGVVGLAMKVDEFRATFKRVR